MWIWIAVSAFCYVDGHPFGTDIRDNYDKRYEMDRKYASVFLNYLSTDSVIVWTDNGSVKFANDTVDTDTHQCQYFEISLIDKSIENLKTNHYRVIVWETINYNIVGIGYMSPDNPFRVFINTSYPPIIELYDKPDFSSPFHYDEDESYLNQQFEVVDFEGRWLKIRIPKYDGYIEGWISPNRQCANVFSTCG